MENLDPPPPQIKDGKMARFCPSRGFILDLGEGGGGGDGGLLFHFILSKIVVYVFLSCCQEGLLAPFHHSTEITAML